MIHEVFSNSQNDASASNGNRPTPNERASYLYCQETGETMVNHGASGTMAQDQAFAGINLPARAPSTQVWLVDLVTNDMRLRPNTSLGKQWFRDFLCACAVGALFGSKKTARSSAESTSGAWVNTQVDPLGMYATASGAKKTFAVSGNAIAVSWLADYHPSSQGIFEIRIDGLLLDTVSTYMPFGNTYKGLRYGPAARIYGVAEGSHIVEVKCISSNTNAYLSYVAGNGDQASLPKVFIGTGSKCSGVPDIVSGEYRQLVLDLVASFQALSLPAKAIDTHSALDPLQHFMGDGIHWNAAGELAVKDLFVAAAREPVTLEFPTVNDLTLFVNLDAYGVATSWAEA